MDDRSAQAAIRRAMGGSSAAISWLVERADTADDPEVVVMAALLEERADRLARAEQLASSVRDRQLVALARASLRGDAGLVDALARDHLVDHPDSVIVAWIASTAQDGGMSSSGALEIEAEAERADPGVVRDEA